MGRTISKSLATTVATLARTRSRQRALYDALYERGHLKIEYDAAMTRNASETFDAHAGNCLSLVIMTGEGEFALTDIERENLRQYIQGGGFLLASAGCSSRGS